MPSDDLVASLDRRVSTLEEERGEIAGELGGMRAMLESQGHQLTAIQDLLEERPSRVEFAQMNARVESVRARARAPMPSQDFELVGPGGFKASLRGFSGFTIVVTVIVGLAGVLAWLLLR